MHIALVKYYLAAVIFILTWRHAMHPFWHRYFLGGVGVEMSLTTGAGVGRRHGREPGRARARHTAAEGHGTGTTTATATATITPTGLPLRPTAGFPAVRLRCHSNQLITTASSGPPGSSSLHGRSPVIVHDCLRQRYLRPTWGDIMVRRRRAQIIMPGLAAQGSAKIAWENNCLTSCSGHEPGRP